MKTIFFTLLSIISSYVFAGDAELRFTQNRVEGNKLYVNVEMRGSSEELNLASHNIRAFYNHEVIEMTEVISMLPSNKYDAPKFKQQYTDGHDLTAGVLSYEDHMGFVNMSTTLTDVVNGGAVIAEDWTALYTMVFDIKDMDGTVRIAWAQEGVTDPYATAFVEVAEWMSATDINKSNLFDLINFELNLGRKEKTAKTEFDVAVGPNPAQSYVTVRASTSDAMLTIVNLQGAIVSEANITDGRKVIDVTSFAAGTYIFIITNGTDTHTEQIIIAE